MSDHLVSWVEIDLTVCSLRWGTAPCTAALTAGTPRKCVQTFLTCRAINAYAPTTETIILTRKGQVGLPIAGRYFPCLTGIRESEQTVNIAGSDPRLDALGRRATVEVNASDFIYADRFLDPYYDERISGAAQFGGVGYEPQGPFWARLRARDPYFAGYPIRVRHGRVVAGALVADRTTHYIATEFDPKGDGAVVWRGVDVLDLASNERALVPRPSRGRLLDDIAEDAESLTLQPAGIGAEYATDGFVTVGREIMAFSRSGDVLQISRGRLGTLPAAHRSLATVQEAYRYQGKAYLAVAQMLTEYAGVPSLWVPVAEWADEAEVWFSVDIDGIITKPMPVSRAVSEMSVMGFSLYTDQAAQRIRFRPNRFLFPPERRNAPLITDADIIGVLDYDGRDSERLTRVEFRTVQIDPTEDLSDNNFVRSFMTIAGDREDPRAHGDIRYRLEKIRWLNQGRDAVVRILANRYRTRFQDGPERVKLKVKRRKYGNIELAAIVAIESAKIPDPHGLGARRLFQVIRRDPSGDGELMLWLQRFEYEGNFGFWAPNAAPDYATATAIQKEDMAFWGPNTGDSFADGLPLYEWG
jgi:hypothetical protein